MADRLSASDLIARLPLAESRWPTGRELQERLDATLRSSICREHWKYSKLTDFIDALNERPVVVPTIRGADQPGVELLDYPGSAEHPRPRDPADEDSASRFPLADLGLLITGRLQVLKVRQSLTVPLEVAFPDGISAPLLIEFAPGVSASLIEQAQATAFGNHSLYLQLGAGSRLNHARVALPRQSNQWSLNQVTLSDTAHYDLQQYCRGGDRRRSETQVILAGRGSQAHLIGAYVVDDGCHLDQQFIVEHRAADTLSRQRFHGIGAGKGTAIFNGRIHIHRNSPRSDATLSNRNLALHPDAQINTKPELEIYTDDVKCAHGATVGQISADSLFYLRSRGLNEIQARQMLCRAFIRECIQGPLEAQASAALLGSWVESTVATAP